MKTEKLIAYSIEIITEYYQDNLEPFFSFADEDILWYGPAEGQYLRSKKALVEAWAREKHPLRFQMGNIQTEVITSGSSFCEIVLIYPVFTLYPSGTVIRHQQRLHYTWCERRLPDEHGQLRRVPRILMIDIMNMSLYSAKDSIYPNHYEEIIEKKAPNSPDTSSLVVHGTDRALHTLPISSFLWAESTDRSQHSLLHLTEGTLLAAESISVLARRYPDLLLRIHSSYLVNPIYVSSLRRFSITMADGGQLPVPTKKYTKVRDELFRWRKKSSANLPDLPAESES